MRIQTLSESFIETYGSIDVNSHCRLTKDPERATCRRLGN